MRYQLRSKWLDLKYFLLPNKYYIATIGLILISATFIFSLTYAVASETKKNPNEIQTVLPKLKKLDTAVHKVITKPGQSSDNLLYQLVRSESEDFQDDFQIDEDIVEYDGYFKRLEFLTYSIRKKDTLSQIAKRHKVNVDTIISFNHIKGVKYLRVGNQLIIPNMKGVLHTVKQGENLKKIVKKYKKYKVRLDDIIYSNEIVNNRITPGEKLFIPGAKLIKKRALVKKLENFFATPIQGRIVSLVGPRVHPIWGRYKYHTGVDIKARYGAPVRATNGGRVKFAGWQRGYGKLVIISHGKGLESKYGHLSKILVRKGMKINKRKVVGKVGMTGYTTGPHLHFEVLKNGKVQNVTRIKGLKGKKGGYWKKN